MTDEAPELLPCPFCGGDGQEKWAHNGKAFCWIECADCGAKGAWARVGHDGSGARNWNTRADLAPQITEEMVERAVAAALPEMQRREAVMTDPMTLDRMQAQRIVRAAIAAALATQEGDDG